MEKSHLKFISGFALLFFLLSAFSFAAVKLTIYENKNFGFKMLAPSGWKKTEQNYLVSKTGHFENVVSFKCPSTGACISLTADISEMENLDDVVYAFEAKARLLSGYKKIKDKKFSDRYIVEYSTMAKGKNKPDYIVKAFILRDKKPNLFTLEFTAKDAKDYKNNREMFAKIVESFKSL